MTLTKNVFLINDDASSDKKAKGVKQCAIKRRLKFEDYKNAHKIIKLEKFKSEVHNVFNEKVNKIKFKAL